LVYKLVIGLTLAVAEERLELVEMCIHPMSLGGSDNNSLLPY